MNKVKIKMARTEQGSEECSGAVQTYEAGKEYIVSPQLADAFSSMGALADEGPSEDELLGKSERKSRLRNKAAS